MNHLVITALEGIGVPFELHNYEGDFKTYITYFFYNSKGERFADNEEVLTGHYLQLDVWSDGNYNQLVKEVKQRLKSVGFKRTTEADLYENDTGVYHKGMRFFYLEESEAIT